MVKCVDCGRSMFDDYGRIQNQLTLCEDRQARCQGCMTPDKKPLKLDGQKCSRCGYWQTGKFHVTRMYPEKVCGVCFARLKAELLKSRRPNKCHWCDRMTRNGKSFLCVKCLGHVDKTILDLKAKKKQAGGLNV